MKEQLKKAKAIIEGYDGHSGPRYGSVWNPHA